MVTKAEARVGSLATWVTLIGLVAAFWGVAYDINAITQAHAVVKVPVSVLASAEGDSWGDVTVAGVSLTSHGDTFLGLAGAPSENVTGGNVEGTLILVAGDSTRVEQAFSRGDWLVGGVAMLWLALLVRPVLWAIARGRPFSRGSGTRLVAAGGVVAVAGVLAPQLPAIACQLVLERTGLDGGRLTTTAGLPIWPLAVGALLASLGVAFRRGETLTREAEGLV